MSFIDTIDPAAARDEVAQMYRRAQADWGYVPGHTRVFSHRPALQQRWAALLAELKRPMDQRRVELVTFVAAHALRSSACALAHGRLMREFFSDEAIVALTEGRFEPVLSPAEAELARFARAVALDASRIEAEQIDALRAHGFSDAEIFDAAAVVAGRAFFTKVLDAMGVQPDAPFAQLPPDLRDALTIGRAIDAGPCLTMPAGPAAAETATGVG